MRVGIPQSIVNYFFFAKEATGTHRFSHVYSE